VCEAFQGLSRPYPQSLFPTPPHPQVCPSTPRGPERHVPAGGPARLQERRGAERRGPGVRSRYQVQTWGLCVIESQAPFKRPNAWWDHAQKLLRHALVRTPEWNNERARCETAGEAEAVGDTVLAALLRRRDSSQLRKAQILHLCHLWRYSSNVWRPRKGPDTVVPPRGAADGAAAATSLGLQRTASAPQIRQSGGTRAVHPGPSRLPSPHPPAGTDVAPSLQQALQAAVTPHCQQAAYWLEGPQMRVQVAAVNAEVFDLQQRLSDMKHGATMLKRIQAAFHAKRLALRSWVTTVQSEQRRHSGVTSAKRIRDAKQAWMALDGDEGVAEQLLRLLAAAWGAAGKDSWRNQGLLMARAQVAGKEEEQHVHLWFNEMRNGFEQHLQLLSVAMALLAPFKCGELGGYILASDAVMEAMESCCQLSEAALTKRCEWIAAQQVTSALPPHVDEAAPPEQLPNTVKAVNRLIEVSAERPPAQAERARP
jgi:hypothetical protein